jgi:hypothetical protein
MRVTSRVLDATPGFCDAVGRFGVRGCGSRRGRLASTGVASYGEGLDALREIGERRSARGYERAGEARATGEGRGDPGQEPGSFVRGILELRRVRVSKRPTADIQKDHAHRSVKFSDSGSERRPTRLSGADPERTSEMRVTLA